MQVQRRSVSRLELFGCEWLKIWGKILSVSKKLWFRKGVAHILRSK